MLDIGFPELFLAALVALLVLGPERLPSALRTLGLWLGRLRRSYYNVKTEVEREIGMDEVRRQLHNEQVMEDIRRVEREVQGIGQDAIAATSGAPLPRRATRRRAHSGMVGAGGTSPSSPDSSMWTWALTRPGRIAQARRSTAPPAAAPALAEQPTATISPPSTSTQPSRMGGPAIGTTQPA
jgi:sec-independent protein translocase protein TatB